MRTLIGALLVTLVFATSAAAQVRPSQGERVRVALSDGERLTGTVGTSADGDLSLVADRGEERMIALSHVASLELSEGRHRRFGKYFFLGLGISSVVGGAIMAATWEPCRETGFLSCLLHPESRGHAMGLGLLAGGAVGVPVGLVAGLTMREERWRAVHMPQPITSEPTASNISIRPLIGAGAGVMATIPLPLR
jgi:hypothetical protein